MAATEIISEFEARRVERGVRQLLLGKLGAGETLRVLGGQLEAGWLSVSWELADSGRRQVYRVEVRTAVQGEDATVKGVVRAAPSSRLPRVREAVELIYDFLAVEFEAYLSEGRRPFTGPRWEEVDFDGCTLHTRGQIIAEAAEQAGDQLLTPPAATEDPKRGGRGPSEP